MPPRQTRRAHLRATGVALAAGLAGCRLEHDPVTETATQGETTDNDRTTPSYGDVGPNADNETRTTPPTTATKTVTEDRSFTLDVRNGITQEKLEEDDDAPADATATVFIDIEENWDDGTETALFERTLELGPGEERTFAEAFRTKLHGPSYVARAKLEEWPGKYDARSRSLSDARRFTPGGFNDPAGSRFRITVQGLVREGAIVPAISLDVPAEEDGG